MSERTRFFILLALLLASLAFVWWLNSSYSHLLVTS